MEEDYNTASVVGAWALRQQWRANQKWSLVALAMTKKVKQTIEAKVQIKLKVVNV